MAAVANQRAVFVAAAAAVFAAKCSRLYNRAAAGGVLTDRVVGEISIHFISLRHERSVVRHIDQHCVIRQPWTYPVFVLSGCIWAFSF
jgi:hypothetical protein